MFKAIFSIPQRERWDHDLKFIVCIFTDWHATGALDKKPQLYDALGQMLFWHHAYFTVIGMLNWGTFAHICKNQNMKSSSLVALQGQGRLRFTCLVVQLIKQLDCFQDSSTPALSFIFLCHYFYGKKKDLFPWNSEVVNLYFAWNKNIFCKWNAYGNTPASSVCLVC